MSEAADLGAIATAFARTAATRLPKHARLYDAVAEVIESGLLAPGAKLAGERELCAATGVSLGTVQKALGLLAGDGRLLREHGRGTFVGDTRRPMTDMWHYRFRNPDTRALLPVYASVHARDVVPGNGPWAAALGFDPGGYVRICRIVSIDDRLRCWSEMYLAATRFGRMLDLPLSDLASVNLKQVLAREFAAPTLSTEQTVRVGALPASVRQALKAAPRTAGLLLQILARSRRGAPLSYQRIFVPPSHLELEVGADVVSAAATAAA